jgi:YVTN family beta-propeller protein
LTANPVLADERLLVAIEGGNVIQLNAKTGAVINQFATGQDAFGVVYSPDGRRAFATDKTAGTLSVLNTATGAVEIQIQLGSLPQQPALSADGRLFIPMSGEGAVLEVESGAAPRILSKIELGRGSKPHIVAISPDKKTVWSTVQGIDPKVVSIDIASNSAVKEYRYDLVPRVIAAFNSGAYFTAHHSTGLHKVDLATGAVTTPFMDQFGSSSEARKQIEGIATSADGNVFAITHEGRKALIAMEQDENEKCEILNLAAKPYWVTLSRNGEVAYVSIPDAGLVQAYNIDDCSQKPLWTARVNGKAKRMDVF